MTDGLSLELGGVSIQRQRDVTFPSAALPSHPKGWNNTWFYCQNFSPAEENPLPGYRPYRLSINTELPGRLTTTEHAQYVPTFSKIRALIANGLTGIDWTRCWVSWRILPLSRCGGLMCQYTGDVKDPQRYNQKPLSDMEINEMVKSLLGEPQENCNKEGLNPFYTLNPAPPVSIFFSKSSSHSFILYTLPLLNLCQHVYICRLVTPSGRGR